MSFVSLKCKNCGSGLTYNDDAQMVTCTHCGSTYMLSELLDEKDLNFIKANKEIDIENKMEVGNLLKQAETYIYQAEYQQAEEIYKRVIELDEKNYKGYFGVVKAKTSNFNKIPETNDYLEYAKIALKYVDSDDMPYVKSELDKLELIATEKKERKRELINAEKTRKINEVNKRANDKFFAKIAYCLIIIITAIILVCLFLTGRKDNNDNASAETTYEITTTAEFVDVFSKSNGLSSTIILKNNLDFSNVSWTPVGTKQKPFSGKLYGNGYTISNLKISLSGDEGENYSGLFGYCKNAYIYKIKLDNVDLESTKQVEHSTNYNFGFVCGYADGSTFKQCEVKNTCDLKINHSNQSTLTVGGIIGRTVNATINDCSSGAILELTSSEITSSNNNLNFYVGGVVGYFDSSNIISSFSTSSVICNFSSSNEEQLQAFTGGIIGYNISNNPNSKYIKNCYFSGNITSNVTATNKTQYVAGIVAYGANQSSMENNLVLNLSSTFVINNSPADATTFFDYSVSNPSCTYHTSQTEFDNAITALQK